MTLTHACSVAAPRDVPGIRLLAVALAEHHPDVRLTVAALPGARRLLEAIDAIDVVTLAQLDAERLGQPLLPTPVLAALARPLLLRRMLGHGAAGALLLAADCDVRGPLEAIEAALRDAEVVLLARVDGGLPDDGERPDVEDLLQVGEIDDEVVAVRDGAHAARFLSWWSDRVVDVPSDGVQLGRGRVAPSPLRAAERALSGVRTLADAGYGVSAWNLHERPLTGADELRAAGRPVRLMRFSGFRADRPWWLSEHASRARVLDDPVLAGLCRERAAALLDAGWEPPLRGDEASMKLAGDLQLDERLRELLLEAADAGEDFGDLGEPAGCSALMAWLDEPAPAGAASGVNRYSYDVWLRRDDLQRAYPDLDGADVEGFIGWLWVHGRVDHKLDARLLPTPPDWVPDTDRSAPSVEVLGYMRGNLGLGQAARGYAAALRAGGVPVGTRTVPLDGPLDERGTARRRVDELAYEDTLLAGDAEVLLVCVNAPQLPGLVEQVGRETFDGRYVIGQWGWEVDAIPSYWDPSFELVDEIWVYSSYVADIIAAVSPKPVVVVPLPMQAPTEVASAHGLELPPGDFTFLFAFDFLSTLQRKNPLGLIEAFKRAFTPGEGPRLVLKTTNARFRGELHDRLRHAIDGRQDIAIVDATLSAPQMAALFADADSYVSLHRAEGFGLTLAESMILGKPVIATRFSGNLDFMSAANSHLVDYELTEVGPEGEHYPARGIWAEPSLEHAAHLMRAVWLDRDGAAQLGARARRDVETQLHPEAVGAIARRRLRHLPGRRRDGQAPAEAPYPINQLERRLRFDLSRGADEAGGARGMIRRTALRAIRPYTYPERELDEALVRSIQRLSTEIDALRAARERDRDRVARIERRLRESESR